MAGTQTVLSFIDFLKIVENLDYEKQIKWVVLFDIIQLVIFVVKSSQDYDLGPYDLFKILHGSCAPITRQHSLPTGRLPEVRVSTVMREPVGSSLSDRQRTVCLRENNSYEDIYKITIQVKKLSQVTRTNQANIELLSQGKTGI